MSEVIVDPINAKFDALAVTTAKNELRREKLIQTAMDAAEKLVIETDGSSKALEAQLGVLTTASSLLKDQEGSQINEIKINLQRKTVDNEVDMAEQMFELMTHIGVGDNFKASSKVAPVDLSGAESAIDEAFAKTDETISEDEKKLN